VETYSAARWPSSTCTHHAEVPIAVATTGGLPDADVTGQAEATDATVVIGFEKAERSPRLHVLPLVACAAAVAFAVDDRDLTVDHVVLALAVDSDAEVGRGHVPVAIDRHGALHAVVPDRLFKVDPRRMDQPELVGEEALARRPAGVCVLEPDHLVRARGAARGDVPKVIRV
jgi:hypothetical protein